MTRRAFVRPPGDSFVRAISTRDAPIDVSVAQAQHVEYCQALAAAGAIVTVLPPDERYPDSCFIQDPALVIGGLAVIGRLAAASRSGEENEVARLLAELYPLARIAAPATLEGGDVLVLPDHVFAGLSDRTNKDGVEQLGQALAAAGARAPSGERLSAQGIPVHGYLHLLSGVTYLGDGILLAVRAFAALPQFAHLNVLVVPDEEAYACNALGLNGSVILPAGYPRTAGMLRSEGFRVLETPTSEFAKADGGVTCLALLY